ncbi:TPA: aminoacyltransferase [Staphylococcus aureus]|nr:aminoacyltransferase [Staphylococcus aureus]HDK9695324.1 aminoacyltransferase [Staphylococcus aureus]HEH0578911.1 aminoacyltransferase [Staphylococcus aureus]
MYFCELDVEEFNLYVDKNFSHYTQSIQNYKFLNSVEKTAYLLGVKDDKNQVLAACLLHKSRALKFFNYFYTHRGPVMDYNNLSLVEFFFLELEKFLKKHRCLYIRIDPHVLENVRTANGEIYKNYNNQNLISLLNNLGYEHQGYDIGYSKIRQIRWLSVLDLYGKNLETLLKNMNYQTRRNIRKTEEMGVKVITLPIEETYRFFNLFKMAEEKHGFSFRDEQYFEKMQRVYKDNGMLKLAYIDLDEYLRKIELRICNLNDELDTISRLLLDNPNSKKSKTKYKQLTELHKKLLSKQTFAINAKETYGNILDLAAALYVYNKHEVYYLSSGSNPEFNEFMGAYALQWEMIKFAKENGIDKYNFYGITGDFSDTAEDFGVQQFKKGFNAHVEEYIGDFIKPFNPILFKFFASRNNI